MDDHRNKVPTDAKGLLFQHVTTLEMSATPGEMPATALHFSATLLMLSPNLPTFLQLRST